MERNIALLIDFENIAAGTEKEGLGRFEVDKVIDRIKDKGRILLARSYADWGRFARFKQGLLTNNVTMYELTSHGMQDKNRADIAMVVDCLELAYTRPYVDTYVVVSGDSDFTPLVLKLRELDKTVIGVGTRKSTSRLIINACDEFIFYDSIVQTKARTRSRPTASASVPKERAKALELLSEVLEGMQREDPTPPHASVLKSAMLRRQPDFNEADLGFGSFARFLEFARDQDYVELTRDPKGGGYKVDATDDDEAEGDTGGGAASAPARGSAGKGGYEDPYLPEGADEIVGALTKAGLGPLSYSTRLALLEQLVELADGKGRRRRRVNIPFAQDELAKRMRRTHPDLKPVHIRDVLRALLKAGLLMHKDGTAIRTATAQFDINVPAPKLNQGLAEVYLRQLRDDGVSLDDTALLAAFLFGDAERTRDVETTIAWLDAPRDLDDDVLQVDEDDDLPSEPAADLDDDLDALLDVDGDDVPAEEAPKKKKRKRSPKKKAPAAEEASAEETPADEQPADEQPEAQEAPAPAEEPADEATEEAPAPVAADDEDDALLDVDEEAPKPRTRRRKKSEED
ncbi:MAG: NYN domain-containing protein [Alphaproteobacteria bacterium]|nr:NYN domain-containing protein [Alphaproteobacteria bacterium]